MTEMTDTHRQSFLQQLHEREQQLLQELAAVQQEQDENHEAKGDFPPEPDANQSRDSSDREVRYAEKLRDQQELADVRAALQRMDDGSFGECVDCGKDIALARLQAFLSAKRCIDCQTLLEAKKQGRPAAAR